MAYCSNCGTNVGGDNFCPSCGTRQQATPPPVRHPVAGPPPAASPPPRGPRRWTAGWITLSAVFLTGLAACGFVVAYFFLPAPGQDNTIAPPPPQLAASTSQQETDAPAEGTSERDAWEELQRIAGQDRAALQSTQLWRAQLASTPVTESAEEFLARYRAMMQEMPNSLLAWSGDWPHSYAGGSRHSWVILSDFTKPRTRPIISWCVQEHRGCWAKRLSTIGTPVDNTDHPPADPGKN